MAGFIDHLIVAPILIPLLAGAVMLIIDGTRRNIRAAIGVVSVAALVVVAITLVMKANAPVGEASHGYVGVYLLGDWPARFGVALVLDRLTAVMLLLTSVLGFATLIFSLARWHGVGAHFHPLFQFQLVGLNGAFLTGDLFNLFVFFEVLLAASYGLLLHGSGRTRVRAGLHYIAINLGASSLFLVGVSLVYSVTGSLNMADIASKVSLVSPHDRVLLEAGAAVLGMAFLIKAGMWPLGLWVQKTYAAATPPVAAMFSIMTKVGVYVVLRLWLLLFGAQAGASAGFGGEWLFIGGMATIVFGAIGVLASQDLMRLAGSCVVVSSGVLLAAIGIGQAGVTAGALFYLVSSTLSIGAFFLLIELVERGREAGADMLAVTMEAFGGTEDEAFDETEEVGFAIPATLAILGTSFVACALLIAGLPPLSGFVAKFALLTALFNPSGLGGGGTMTVSGWMFFFLLIFSGLAALIAMTRAGIRSFWLSLDREVPRIGMIEIAPVAALLILCIVMTVQAGPVMRYMRAAAQSLHMPQDYMSNVLSASHIKGKLAGGTP